MLTTFRLLISFLSFVYSEHDNTQLVCNKHFDLFTASPSCYMLTYTKHLIKLKFLFTHWYSILLLFLTGTGREEVER